MILNGKAWLTKRRAMELLGYDPEHNIDVPTYKKMFAQIEKLKVGKKLYFLQSDVYKILEEKEAKSQLLCQVQSLVMYILDNTQMNKKQVAKLLGFKGPHSSSLLNTWLANTTYTKTVARVLVLANKHFPHYIKQFDEIVA
jgi:predicted XRE-type DNA-binding protein